MKQKGFSLIEVTIGIGLLGFIGLFVTTYMDKLHSDANRMELRNESMDLRNKLSENFRTVSNCRLNLDQAITLGGLNKNPLQSFDKPLEVPKIVTQDLVPGSKINGGVTVVKMELISSVKTPNTPLKEIVNQLSSDASMVEKFYRTLFRITLKKANNSQVSLLFPLSFNLNSSGNIDDCRLSSASTPSTAQTCTSILHEDSGVSTFNYSAGNCEMKIRGQKYKVYRAEASANGNILCQLQKKIREIKPLDGRFSPTHCP